MTIKFDAPNDLSEELEVERSARRAAPIVKTEEKIRGRKFSQDGKSLQLWASVGDNCRIFTGGREINRHDVLEVDIEQGIMKRFQKGGGGNHIVENDELLIVTDHFDPDLASVEVTRLATVEAE